MTFVDLRCRLDEPEIRRLLAVLAWTGTPEHLDRICSRYRGERLLLGYEVNGALVGCIGVQRISDDTAVVRHIVVDASYRQQGIGREMVEHVRQAFGERSLTAETDQEAVGFYERCGFTVQSLGLRYPGVERFLCTLRSPT